MKSKVEIQFYSSKFKDLREKLYQQGKIDRDNEVNHPKLVDERDVCGFVFPNVKCPSCSKYILEYEDKYCSSCGVRLKWNSFEL